MKKGAKTKKNAKKKAAKGAKKAAKKTAKKKTAKKTKPSKGTVEVTVRKKILGQAPEEYHFVLEDGRKLASVYELIDELETMTEDQFERHVNEMKNDFANWVEHVFDERTLADEMREIQDRLDTQRALLKEIVRKLIAKK